MCTVTIVPLVPEIGRRAGDPVPFRLVSSRDEQRTRAEAAPPERFDCGTRTGLYPVDGDAHGTWVGVNDAGLALNLLNLNLPAADAPPVPGTHTRGAIIPRLLRWDRVDQAVVDVVAMDPGHQRPFRLVLVDGFERAVVRSDGQAITVVERGPHDGVFFATSSGLGDHVVEGPRRATFDRLFGSLSGRLSGRFPGQLLDPLAGENLDASAGSVGHATAGSADQAIAAQDELHRQFDPDAPDVSISLDRSSAITVSLTEVTVGDRRVKMVYRPGIPHVTDAPPITATLPLRELTVG
ncbi:MAG: NRDE family protein [Phycisphaerales bacterium]